MNDKKRRIPDGLLAAVNEFISGRMGLHFPEGRRKDLERGLRLAAHEFGFQDPEAFSRWLISAPLEKDRIQLLASYITVGETYFFRDRKCFDFLEERALPELIELRRDAGKYLRIWSAGCCTGEEPFSVAILLSKLLPDIMDWKITILATDINPVFIRKASAGIYGDWSFRDGPKWIREKYFAWTKGNRYEILPEIRQRVFFQYHNLAENDYPSSLNTDSMDLILCRNVLMYSTPDHQNHVTWNLRRCLVEGGWLIVSPSEAYDPLFPGFTGVSFHGATFYRKAPENPGAGGVSSEEQERSGLPARQWPAATRIDDVRSFTPHFRTSKEDLPPKPVEERPRAQEPLDSYEEALAFYEKGRQGRAVKKLMVLLSDASQEARAAALLARILAGQGRLSEAVAFCRRAVAADRCNPGHYYLLATILEEQGLLQDAASELRNTLYLDQDFVLAHFLLGNLSIRHGNRKESARHFRNAFKLLSRLPSEEIIPGAEGLTAGRLKEIIQSNAFEEIP